MYWNDWTMGDVFGIFMARDDIDPEFKDLIFKEK